LARRGLSPRIGRNAGEDDRIDTTGLKLLLKVGSGKCAPVTFCKQDVARLKSSRRATSEAMAGQRCIPQIDWLVSRKLGKIVEVDADLNHRSTVAAKCFGQLYRIVNDLCGRVRRRTHGDDGIPEVHENKCGLVGSKLKFLPWDSLRKRSVTKIAATRRPAPGKAEPAPNAR